MKNSLILLLASCLLHFASFAQTDTAVARLKSELQQARSWDQKMSTLKSLIDYTAITDPDACANYINQALFMAEETRDRKKMADIRLHISRAFTTQGGIQSLLDKAEAYCTEALKICKANPGLEKEEIVGQLQMARIHRNSGRSDKAIETSNTAIALANDYGDDSLRVIAYLGMGRNYMYRDEKLNSYKNFLIAESIADQSRHSSKDWLQISCYRSLAEFFSGIKNYDKAIDYYKLVIDYNIQGKYGTDLMNNTRTVGELYRSAGNTGLAQSYIERSIEIADSIKNFEGKIQGTLAILNVMLSNHESEKTLAYLASHREIEDYFAKIKMSHYLDKAKGTIFGELRNADSALYYFRKVEPAFQKETNVYTIAVFNYEYALTLRRIGKQKEAIPYLEKAMQLSSQANNIEGMSVMAAYLDSCYRETGDYRNALNYASLHQKYKDSLELLGKEKDLISLEIESEKKKKERLAKEEAAALERRHNIQYTAIVMLIIAVFIILVSFGFLKVPVSWIKVLGFFSFIFFFEFIILIADQQIHHLTHGEPWKILAIKVGLIAILLPFHHMVEKRVVEMITAQRLKRESAAKPAA